MLEEYKEFNIADKRIRKTTKYNYKSVKVGGKVKTMPVELEDMTLEDLKNIT